MDISSIITDETASWLATLLALGGLGLGTAVLLYVLGKGWEMLLTWATSERGGKHHASRRTVGKAWR